MNVYLLLQLADSAFPGGGFAHSGGLEAAMHHGLVGNRGQVFEFARHTVLQTAAASLPFVTAAHSDERRSDLDELDELCDAFLTNPIANKASRAQGRALVTTAARCFSEGHLCSAPAALVALEDRVAHGSPAHHAVMFGAVMRSLDVSLADARSVFMFMAARGVASAAVRLGLIGGYDAQTLLAGLAAEIDDAIDRFGAVPPMRAAQTAPLIDLAQSTHDRLYSRLFQS